MNPVTHRQPLSRAARAKLPLLIEAFAKRVPRLAVVAIAIGFASFSFGPPGARQALAAPAIQTIANTRIEVEAKPEKIKWGEEVEVTVSAVNSTGMILPGGLYVSFDEDVLVLEVKGGRLLRPGDSVYNLKTSTSQPLSRPVIESFEQTWPPGVERRVAVLVLPIARERLRVRGRATFLESGRQPQIHISPGPLESRSLDESEFPTMVTYVWISRHASLRRAIRRFERRLRDLDEAEQRRFALALAAALEDPKALDDLLEGSQAKQPLTTMAPSIAAQLRRDPINALDNLRCLMSSLGCRNALVYFGVPLELYRELSTEEAARDDAKQQITNQKGGNELVALLDAEGFSYRRDKAGGPVIIQLEGSSVRVETNGQIVMELLDRIIAVLGPAAEKTHSEANGMSFALLRSQLRNTRSR